MSTNKSCAVYIKVKLFRYNSSHSGKKPLNLLSSSQISIPMVYPFCCVWGILCTRVLEIQLAAFSWRRTKNCGFSCAPLVLICKPSCSQRNARHFSLRETAASTSNILLLLSNWKKRKQNTNKHFVSLIHLILFFHYPFPSLTKSGAPVWSQALILSGHKT